MRPSPQSFGWALLGPGRIARQFAAAARSLPDTHIEAVWGRRAERAQALAVELGLPGSAATGELEQVLRNPAVRGVYVATTHDAHAELVRRALAAGKPVLCEKPLTTSARLAGELVDLSRSRGVFLMEALWTRFLPVYEGVARWLEEGRIGTLRSIGVSFCFPAEYDARGRLFHPDLAGGSLLDIGVYNIAMIRWALEAAHGAVPPVVSRSVLPVLAPTGVDQAVSALMRHADGTSVQFLCAFDRFADNTLVLHGSQGAIEVRETFWKAEAAVLRRRGQADEWLRAPLACNGFEYEIAAAMHSIGRGEIECPRMPHGESVAIARELDALRELAGVRYPFD